MIQRRFDVNSGVVDGVLPFLRAQDALAGVSWSLLDATRRSLLQVSAEGTLVEGATPEGTIASLGLRNASLFVEVEADE